VCDFLVGGAGEGEGSTKVEEETVVEPPTKRPPTPPSVSVATIEESTPKPKPEDTPTPTPILIDWKKTTATLAEIETMGMENIKRALAAEGCKCGKALAKRAGRLMAIRGLERKDYPSKVRGKNFRV